MILQNWLKIFLISIITQPIFLLAASNSQLTPAQTKFHVSISQNKILLLDDFSEHITFQNAPDMLFFAPKSSKLNADATNYLLKTYALFLFQNPDAILCLKGFYSRNFDGVMSSALGRDLALERANAVFSEFATKFPALADRIEVSEKHNYEAPHLSALDTLCARVEFELSFGTNLSRNFYAREKAPFWRDSYKEIIKDVAPTLATILERNPGACIGISGIGLGMDKNAYDWMFFLKTQLNSTFNKNQESRIFLNTLPDSTKTPSAKLSVFPTISFLEPIEIQHTALLQDSALAFQIGSSATLPNVLHFSLATKTGLPIGVYTFSDANCTTIDTIRTCIFNLNDVFLLPCTNFWSVQCHPYLQASSKNSLEISCGKTFNAQLLFGDIGSYNVNNEFRLFYIAQLLCTIAQDYSGNCAVKCIANPETQAILRTQISHLIDENQDKITAWLNKNKISFSESDSSDNTITISILCYSK